MDLETIIKIGQEALLLTIVMTAPAVIAAVVVGLAVSLLQAATQIQEQTLTFAAKLVAVAGAVAITGLWMLSQLSQFTTSLFDMIAGVR